MQIIGAGLPRTATLTQKIALEMLGFGPCYHMVNVLTDSSRIPGWTDALDGRAEWGKIFEGFNSTVDYPGSFFVSELADEYPDAKFVLSTRDGRAWARSVRDTVWGALHGDGLTHHLGRAQAEIDAGMRAYTQLMERMFGEAETFGPEPTRFDEEIFAAGMERHNEAVRQCVPPGRLLEWHPADGWAPLCEFLDRPIPAAPLPRVNDTSAFNAMSRARSLEVLNQWQARQVPFTPAAHP